MSTDIMVTLDGRKITGTLDDNPAAASLIDQLPLQLSFRDYNSQEVIADLPQKLSMQGMPRGADPAVADIGYNHNYQVLVFHYSTIGFWSGTAVLGHLNIDPELLKNWRSAQQVTIELTE